MNTTETTTAPSLKAPLPDLEARRVSLISQIEAENDLAVRAVLQSELNGVYDQIETIVEQVQAKEAEEERQQAIDELTSLAQDASTIQGTLLENQHALVQAIQSNGLNFFDSLEALFKTREKFRNIARQSPLNAQEVLQALREADVDTSGITALLPTDDWLTFPHDEFTKSQVLVFTPTCWPPSVNAELMRHLWGYQLQVKALRNRVQPAPAGATQPAVPANPPPGPPS